METCGRNNMLTGTIKDNYDKYMETYGKIWKHMEKYGI